MKKTKPTDWPLLTRLFWSFSKIGPITFGGGYAMIPAFHEEVVEKRGWLSEEEVADLFAIAQSTPGAIGINAATFVGYRIAGVRGAVAALVGVLLPTFLIVLAMSIAFLAVKDQPKIQAAFQGIRPAVVALIAYAGYRVGRTAVKDVTTLLLATGSLVLLIATGMNPLYVLLLGMALGMVIVSLRKKWTGVDVIACAKEPEGYIEDYFIGDGI
jgi:chromate transporter